MKKADKEEQSDGPEEEEEEDDDNAPAKLKRHVKQVECIMGNLSEEQLRNMHPQRSTHSFALSKSVQLTITSNFDAGNMVRCEQGEQPNHFNIWMSSDSMPYYKYTGFRAWFYFAVKGCDRGRLLHFHIKNMNYQRQLFAAGLKPFFRVGDEGRFRRIPGKITWGNGPDGLQVNFDHLMSSKDPEQLTYFSFVEPWGYEDTVKFISKCQEKIQGSQRLSDEVYFHRELLGYSKELRYVELITITGKGDNNTKKREDRIDGPGIFPVFEDGSPEAELFSKQRTIRFEKPTIFLTARVHPGEVCASHVLNGVLEFLLSKSLQASVLLEKYQFKIIPLLNPDGVARGYFRLDTHNHNLNRFYQNPDPVFQPTIFQAKKAIVQQHQMGNLKIYIDLHGHASKKGCFIFGNNLKGEQQAQNMLFARLISLNSLNFDFQECSFSEKLMTVKDGGSGLSREGSGRVGIFKATNLVNCYTLECHFQTGKRINVLTPKYNLDTNEIESEEPETDRNTSYYKDVRTPNYCVDIFQDVGRAICVALLELAQANPVTRMATSHYRNLESVRKEIIVQNNLLPYEQMKELRREVQKERELMKTRQKKLQAQIQAKQEAEAKKAAKIREKEERVAELERLQTEKEVKRLIRRPKAKVSGLSSQKDVRPRAQPEQADGTSLPSIHNNTKTSSLSTQKKSNDKLDNALLRSLKQNYKNSKAKTQSGEPHIFNTSANSQSTHSNTIGGSKADKGIRAPKKGKKSASAVTKSFQPRKPASDFKRNFETQPLEDCVTPHQQQPPPAFNQTPSSTTGGEPFSFNKFNWNPNQRNKAPCPAAYQKSNTSKPKDLPDFITGSKLLGAKKQDYNYSIGSDKNIFTSLNGPPSKKPHAPYQRQPSTDNLGSLALSGHQPSMPQISPFQQQVLTMSGLTQKQLMQYQDHRSSNLVGVQWPQPGHSSAIPSTHLPYSQFQAFQQANGGKAALLETSQLSSVRQPEVLSAKPPQWKGSVFSEDPQMVYDY